MQFLHITLQWFITPTGRTAAAAVIFGLLWLAKNIPVVSAWLAVDRRKVIANVVLALGPAAVVLLDQSKPAVEAWAAALQIMLGAAGLQGVITGLLGDRLSKKLKLSSLSAPSGKGP